MCTGRLDDYHLRSLAALSESKSGKEELDRLARKIPEKNLLDSVREDESEGSM